MVMRRKRIVAIGLIVAMMATVFMFTACNEAEAKSGGVMLKVNPEVVVNYNDQGLVTSIEGVNDDGKKIVESYSDSDYVGKEAKVVIKEVVGLINKGGYLKAGKDGKLKDITMELTDDSYIPDDQFVDDLYESVKIQVQEGKIPANVQGIDDDQYYDNSGYAATKATKKATQAYKATKSKSVNNNSNYNTNYNTNYNDDKSNYKAPTTKNKNNNSDYNDNSGYDDQSSYDDNSSYDDSGYDD